MKKVLSFLLALGMVATSASALTPDQLGEILKERYAGDIPQQVWEQDTVEGMLQALGDPFTHYYTAQEYAQLLSELGGEGSGGPTAAVEERNGVGHARIDVFGSDTYGILKAGVEKLDPQVERWIVDLRGNGGGELKATVDAASVFAGAGRLVYLRDKDNKLYAGRTDHSDLTIDPVIVLVDGKTASGAEIFAAAIRDRRAGLVMGTRTYGKGAAQTALTQKEYPQAFADGSVLALTTEKVFSGELLSHNVMGVLPHLMVEDRYVETAAQLLCAAPPKGDTRGYLRLHMGGWRWYVDPKAAAGEPEALGALLAALPPAAVLYLGTGGNEGWRQVTAAEAARQTGAKGYAARVFPDGGRSQYAQAIDTLKTYGILQGDENGNFNPKDSLDRATLCALLAQAMGYPKATGEPAFADTPAQAWYTPYVTTLSAMGIINGYDDGLFHPDDPIPHQQFMAILARIAGTVSHRAAQGMAAGIPEETMANGDYVKYDPWARVAAWALDGAWHAPAKDIDPRGVTLREEAAYDLWSMLVTLGVLAE